MPAADCGVRTAQWWWDVRAASSQFALRNSPMGRSRRSVPAGCQPAIQLPRIGISEDCWGHGRARPRLRATEYLANNLDFPLDGAPQWPWRECCVFRHAAVAAAAHHSEQHRRGETREGQGGGGRTIKGPEGQRVLNHQGKEKKNGLVHEVSEIWSKPTAGRAALCSLSFRKRWQTNHRREERLRRRSQ